MTSEKISLKLPFSLVGKSDVTRLLRELSALENYVIQARIRMHSNDIPMPKVSILLELLCRTNEFDLNNDKSRNLLTQELLIIHEKAPQVHISFGVNPSAAMIEKLVRWFREQAHPQTLIQSGLQPGLSAGCMVRTANQVFDLSLRRKLKDSASVLETLLVQNSAAPAETTEVVA